MADEIKFKNVLATNVTGGPKVFNSAPAVVLAAGASTDGEVAISEAELKSMEDTGYFKFGGDPLDHDGDGEKGGAKASDGEASDEAVKSAVDLLDAAKDEHWTAAGLPSVEAVSAIAEGKVTRAQIERVAPDAKRPDA